MIWEIYKALMADNEIVKMIVPDGIKFYEYPPTGDFTGPHITIEPLAAPKPSDYADNKWLTKDYLFQIEVWSLSRDHTEVIAERIQKIMWNKLGFYQSDGIDEYDKDLKIYRDARRYRGKQYVI